MENLKSGNVQIVGEWLFIKVLKSGQFYECIEKECKYKEPVPENKLK